MTNQTKQYRVTRESCRLARACYKDDRLAKLIPPEGLTPEEVAAAEVPVDDRIWALCYAAGLDSKLLRLFACRTARRALARIANPDPRSIAAVDTAERFARGEATKEELEVARKQAYYAAYDSVAYDSAYYSAAYAAYSAASAAYAAYAPAARQAELELQLQDLLSCFKTEQGEINDQKTEVRLLPGQATGLLHTTCVQIRSAGPGVAVCGRESNTLQRT